MRRMLFSFLIGILALLSVSMSASDGIAGSKRNYPYGYPQTDRSKECINADWKFHLGDADARLILPGVDDGEWETVSVPHTLKLTSIGLDGCKDDKTQPTFQREVGWYRKNIYVSGGKKKVFLEFEGAHQITTLWVNGKKVGIHKTGGYTPFRFDITNYVKCNADNQVTLLVDNRRSQITPPDPGPFDYIKFSGLYRDVYLVEMNPVHITSNLESMNSGVTITTPSVDYVNGNATVDIRSEVRNETSKAQKVTLVQRVVDAGGNVVLKLEDMAEIQPGQTHRFYQIGGMEDGVMFWSVEHPYLYKVNTVLYDASGRAIDVVDNRLGLRKVEYDYETGFRLNGKPIELIGFNRHQHYAYIGDALPNSLHYKDMIQFKQWGFNCMRTAHYPQDDEIIRACDELGILVYEEAPTWVSVSTEKEWYVNEKQAIRMMIRNHKNSPSIIIWGAGINHRGPVPEMHFLVKQEDPTRLTASQSSRWTGWQCSGWTDIFANMNYGPGIWNRQEPLFAMEGNSGPEVVASYKRDPMMPGIISWTAHAYYTFHDIGDWEDRTRLGMMNAFRYPIDDNLYWYPSEMKQKPYIHVKNDWTKELKMLTIYSNATEIELLLNDKSLGRFQPSHALKYQGLSHPPYEISELPYEDGKLTIRGYRDGEIFLEKDIFTPGEATALRLIVDKYDRDFKADGNDILVVHAEVVDKNGMRLHDYQGEVEYQLTGDAAIVGDGQGIGANPVRIKRGVGSALVRAGKTPGQIKITASAKGLRQVSATVETVASETDCMLAEAYPIYDSEKLMIDMGGSGQLLQFGWTPWNGVEEKEANITVLPAKLNNYVAGDTPPSYEYASVVDKDEKEAYSFTIHTNSSDGMLRWLGEMNVIGKNGFVYGDGVLGLDKKGVTLELKQLPAGNYILKSYHHAPSSNTDSMDPNLEKLKQESVHKLPYAKVLNVSVDGDNLIEDITVTDGKERQYEAAGTSVVTFSVKTDGQAVKVIYRSADKNIGVWLNGFELVRKL